MIGLLFKDFFCLRKGLGVYLLITVIYGGLALGGVIESTFFSWFFTLSLSMLPLTCFALDEAAKWDVYAFTLPVGRRQVVAARYLLLLLLTLVALSAALVMGLLLLVLGRVEDWSAYLVSSLVAAALGMLVNTIQAPFFYRLGANRARVVGLCLLGGLLLLCLAIIQGPLGPPFLSLLEAPPAALPILFPLAAVGVLALSFALSCRFYGKKEL